ncbi:DUF4145 domain-containing protein [Nocardia amikacinitolerans]|uniref:DUF4145 domain-containing protein n=1 Tax=Nocardia amikacinitolerans TaxID=756689 RepID=UPI0020A5D6B4|nr:DUF4145 domain-containing protein [Nocardia amikacinitolerans]
MASALGGFSRARAAARPEAKRRIEKQSSETWMKNQVRRLAERFLSASFPALPCPICSDGTLSVDKDAIKEHACRAWKEDNDYPHVEPWGIFSGYLMCNNTSCGDVVAVSGYFHVDDVYGGPYDAPTSGTYYLVRTLFPPVEVVEVPDDAPSSVRETLTRAAAVCWQDPSAGVTLLRQAIERLMDAHGIPDTRPNGRRGYRSLHDRLEDFEASHSDAAELLEAAKWVGNEGAHPGELKASDFIDSAELVEVALGLLYAKDTTAVRARAQRIKDAKGLVP